MSNKKTRIAVVGLSGRGAGMLDLLLQIPNVEVPAVCDLIEERRARGVEIVKKHLGEDYPVKSYADYKELLHESELDALMCCTTWITHSRIAVAAMRAGLDVALEVGGAASIEECWQLVRTSEETGKFCMLLENCCYDRKEMLVFNMVKQGLFGEITHCEGGYRHDLRDEICLGRENIHGRLYNFMHRNGELYPTHQLGPICKLLNINRGNKLLYLTSMSSKSAGLNEWIRLNKGETYDLCNYPFACGDVVTTMIKCLHGETITLFHDCSTPRPYSRNYVVEGTRGSFMEISDRNSLIYIDGKSKAQHEWDVIEDYYDKYDHPLWNRYTKSGIKAGHGGMDYLVLSAFVDSVKNKTQPPIDVYDTATWMAITCLSEQSVAMGSQPVPIPDFTNGAYIDREPFVRGPYCLCDVCNEFFDTEEEN